MSLVLDIGTGTGLASSTGVRPYLPPLLAGGLARGDVTIDFDGTDFSFLESVPFLAAVVVAGAIVFLAERSDTSGEGRRRPAQILSLLIGMSLGALLFAGTLADGDHPVWIGLMLGPFCAVLAWVAVGGLVERARSRLDAEQAGLLTVYADAVALLLAAIAIFVPPLAFLAIPGFLVLLLGGRRREGEKYAGLRILR